jgi:hypothetical protein
MTFKNDQVLFPIQKIFLENDLSFLYIKSRILVAVKVIFSYAGGSGFLLSGCFNGTRPSTRCLLKSQAHAHTLCFAT